MKPRKKSDPVVSAWFFLALIPLSFLSLLPAAHAGSMTLLAVSETANGMVGSVADLSMDMEAGKGRVFMETYPVAKFDTQLSTRIAAQIACSYLHEDCSTKDFFYTINAHSSIIGGPSAGAAVAVLTVAEIAGVPIDQRTAITGTINSGGLIGPVGGIKEKIEAAKSAGMTRVLIPRGEAMREIPEQIAVLVNETNATAVDNATSILPKDIPTLNETLDLVAYGKQLGLEVIEVGTLDEAVQLFTGKQLRAPPAPLVIDPAYTNIMRYLAVQLCNRSQQLSREVDQPEERAINLTTKGVDAFYAGRFYTAASYCYGSNVVMRQQLLRQAAGIAMDAPAGDETSNETEATSAGSRYDNNSFLQGFQQSIITNISAMQQLVDSRDLNTMLDLQATIVVKERLIEADYFAHLNTDPDNLGLAAERLESARSWDTFFGKGQKQLTLDATSLSGACIARLAEAEERLQYVALFYPLALDDARRDLDRAYTESRAGARSHITPEADDASNASGSTAQLASTSAANSTLCIFHASKAKAQADVILGVLGADEQQVQRILAEKLSLARDAVAQQGAQGAFPVLGYSYYEYASDLADEDQYLALLYAEYALELSGLQEYLPHEPAAHLHHIDLRTYLPLGFAFLLGAAATLLYVQLSEDFKPGRPRREPRPAGKKR